MADRAHKPAGTLFLPEAHRLRGLAILAVMLGHLGPRVFEGQLAGQGRLLGLVMRNGTVWFVFLSGMLLQHLSARFRYADHLRARADQVLVPYFLWSSLVLSWMWLDLRPEPFQVLAAWPDTTVAGRAAIYVLTGAHLEQLWYVPVATLFFVGGPLWLRLGRSRYLPVVVLLSVGLSMLVPRGAGEDSSRVPVLQPFAHFVSVYLLGIAFAVHRTRAMELCRRFAVPMLLAAVAMLAAQFFGLPGGSRYGYFQKLLLIGPLLTTLERADRWPEMLKRALDWLAEHSFTLYFVHLPLQLLVTGRLFRHKAETFGILSLALASIVGVLFLTQRMPRLFAVRRAI